MANGGKDYGATLQNTPQMVVIRMDAPKQGWTPSDVYTTEILFQAKQ